MSSEYLFSPQIHPKLINGFRSSGERGTAMDVNREAAQQNLYFLREAA